MPAVAVTLVGTPGTTAGVNHGEKLEIGPVPIPFVAVTLNA